MADPQHRWPDNAPGPVFVDEGCIWCALCTAIAPEHFDLGDEGEHARCIAQPTDRAGREACREAAEACPVDAIGGAEVRWIGASSGGVKLE